MHARYAWRGAIASVLKRRSRWVPEQKSQWPDHTFNPWWGCLEVSPGCDHEFPVAAT